MVRKSRNMSIQARTALAAPVRAPEQIDRVPEGPGPTGEPEYSTVYTGRARRPESLEEWCGRRAHGLARFRHLPAVNALVLLLEAGQDADVKAAGKPLDDWQRNGVLTALGELADAARQDYPPAAAAMLRLQAAWRRQWGNRQVIPPRVREVKPERRPRVVTGADGPPGIEHLAAAWGSPLGSA